MADAAFFFAAHRMSADKFEVGAQHVLYRVYRGAFYAAYVGKQRAFCNEFLIFPYPAEHGGRVKGEHD